MTEVTWKMFSGSIVISLGNSSWEIYMHVYISDCCLYVVSWCAVRYEVCKMCRFHLKTMTLPALVTRFDVIPT